MHMTMFSYMYEYVNYMHTLAFKSYIDTLQKWVCSKARENLFTKIIAKNDLDSNYTHVKAHSHRILARFQS